MDENLSWRAKLAKSNINILAIEPNYWLVEFTYHPKPGTFKWCKTSVNVPEVYDTCAAINEDKLVRVGISSGDMAQIVLDEVLKLRKELEG